MDRGQDISFIFKRAEELKEDEKPVTAPAPAPTESEVKTDTMISAVLPELPQPTKAESENTSVTVDQDKEKTAADVSARDKAMELAAKAGRPTSTGIVAGAGLGSIMAALGALSRANSEDEEHSVLSNPALLGLLGAAGGYVGGNLLNDSPKVAPAEGGKANLTVPGLVATLGTLGFGKGLADMDKATRDAAIEQEFPRLARLMPKDRKGNIDLNRATPEQTEKFFRAKNEFKKLKERKGLAENVEEMGLGRPHSDAKIRAMRLADSTWNPINQLKALNPFKKVKGAPVQGASLLKKQILTALMGSKSKGIPKLPGRLAALAALAGAGTLGVNAVRNVVSED